MKTQNAARSIALLAIALLAAANHARAAGKIVIPEGTPITLELVDALSSETNRKGDEFRLRLAEDLTIEGKKVIGAGATAAGAVTVAQPRGRLARQGRLGIELATLEIKGGKVEIRVSRPEEEEKASRGRKLLSRLASPVKRVAHNLAAAADLDKVDGRATAAAQLGEISVKDITERALDMVDPLAGLELGKASRSSALVSTGVRGLERVGTGYVVSILSGPTGLMKKGSSVEVPAGTTLHAVIVSTVTL